MLLLGTSLIALPSDIADMMNAQIGATKSWNGQYTVDCSTVPSLPDLTFYFGGKPFPIKATDYILEVQGTCISSFTGLDMPNGLQLWIVGKPFCVIFPDILWQSFQVTSSYVNTTRFTTSAETLSVSPKLHK